jgi:uncharacterized membrane protein
MADKRRAPRPELLELTVILGLAALGCVLLYGLRVAISGRIWYLYLVQNLALAMVPYLIAAVASLLVERFSPSGRRSTALGALGFLWLLFYPNAPYIFTDFIHVIDRTYLRVRPSEWFGPNAMLWYDLIMNAAFAFMGHFIGLVSMWLVHTTFRRAWGRARSHLLVLSAILFSGFGIYLGRFSRLNSWDVLFDPPRVLEEIAEATADLHAILFSAAFSLFIFLTYAALVVFKRLAGTTAGTEAEDRGSH